MPSINSKHKTYRPMAEQSVGRVFCVTGIQANERRSRNQAVTPATNECNNQVTTTTGQSDTDSNTSGYLSSSSFESSGEEKRLVPNEQKVFRIWDKWGKRVRAPSGPKSSTPKQGSEAATFRRRVNTSGESGKSLLVFKKSLTEKTADEQVLEDSFWDIKTPRVHKSSSEGDIRKDNKSVSNCSWKRKGVAFADQHDAGLDISSRRNSSNSQEWRRRPFITQSTSHQDLRLPLHGSSESRKSDNSQSYSALPRYRVKVNADTNLVSQICRSCADFADEGKPVDESMTEFLSNVDQDNLASFLNFYDKVTNSTEYERARKNPNNYEAVYY